MRIKQKRGRAFQPDSIAAYFRLEWLPLTLITLSGLAYNVGLLAGPWFEGRLAQCLADILGGRETAAAMTDGPASWQLSSQLSASGVMSVRLPQSRLRRFPPQI